MEPSAAPNLSLPLNNFYLFLCVMKEPMHTPQLRWRPQDLGVERVSHLDLGLGFELRLSGLRIKCLTG